jgi:hypothetical protein
MPLVKAFGLHWPRNAENLDELEDLAGHKSGIYILYHGAMPVYIGRGNVHARLRKHSSEVSRKNQYWDRFSWFVIGKMQTERDLETLLLEALPFYVRSLNKQSGKLPRAGRHKPPSNEVIYIELPKLAPLRRAR